MSNVFYVNEKNNYKLSFQLVDESGNGVPSYNIASLQLTQYYFNPDLTTSDRYHLRVINNRNAQNVLNSNNVAVDSTGNVVWDIQPADTIKLSTADVELHVALFKWRWGSGKRNSQEIFFYVRKIPYAT